MGLTVYGPVTDGSSVGSTTKLGIVILVTPRYGCLSAAARVMGLWPRWKGVVAHTPG